MSSLDNHSDKELSLLFQCKQRITELEQKLETHAIKAMTSYLSALRLAVRNREVEGINTTEALRFYMKTLEDNHTPQQLSNLIQDEIYLAQQRDKSIDELLGGPE